MTMNSDEMWLLQLWSGTFAAAVSGVVAVLVLKLSNSHQATLAERARVQAARHSKEQLDAQAASLQEQLAAQEASLNKQLDEQRREASKSREIMAIADMILAADDLVASSHENGSEPESESAGYSLRASAMRWRLELEKGPMRKELFRFVYFLDDLATRARGAISEEESQQMHRQLTDAVSVFRFELMDWPNADLEKRARIADEITGSRVAIELNLRRRPAEEIPFSAME